MADPESLRAPMPLSNMKVGQDAIDRGQATSDKDLMQQGYAIKTMAVYVAHQDPGVPQENAQKVVAMAAKRGSTQSGLL